MNRKPFIIGAVALVSMLAGVALHHYLDAERASASPQARHQSLELHSIPLTDLGAKQTLLGQWRGKVLIVNFWAPWCAPCRREIPSLIEIRQEFAAREVEVLGIAFDHAAQVDRFVDDYRIQYPIFLAANRSAMYNAVLGNPSGSLPYTVLLDRELRIVFQHNGELSAAQLRQQLKALL